MKELVSLEENEPLFNGQVRNWEDTAFGHRLLFKCIINASTFRETDSSGDGYEIFELFPLLPSESIDERTKLKVSYLDKETGQKTGQVVALDRDNPLTVISPNSRFELDSTESKGMVAYSHFLYGQKPMVRVVWSEEGFVLERLPKEV